MSKIHLKTGKGCFTYEAGTTLEAISRDFQEDYPHDIILARVDGKLAELNSCMDRDAEIEFITTGEAVGNEVYRRTASMMMLKAFQDVVGRDNFERLTVQYSLDRGYYCELVSDTAVTERLLDKVKTRMMEIQQAKMPIIKKSLPKREAIEMFREHKMYDKVNLFYYRRSSRVNIYMLEDTIDYFYGYMASNTAYIRYFDLYLYDDAAGSVELVQDNVKCENSYAEISLEHCSKYILTSESFDTAVNEKKTTSNAGIIAVLILAAAVIVIVVKRRKKVAND